MKRRANNRKCYNILDNGCDRGALLRMKMHTVKPAITSKIKDVLFVFLSRWNSGRNVHLYFVHFY